jgi:chromosome segregation ATPase
LCQSAAEIFDFDISQYIGQGATSAERSPQLTLADDIKQQLSALLPFLRQSIEDLTKNSEPVRTVFKKLEDVLPEDLVDALNAASYLESHRLIIQRARQRIASRSEQKKTATSLTLHKSMAVNHKNTLEALLAKPSVLKNELAQLKQEAADLERALAVKKKAIEEKERELDDLPGEVERQRALLSSAIQDTMRLVKSSKPIPGTDADDLAEIDKIDNIRRHALDLLSKYLD